MIRQLNLIFFTISALTIFVCCAPNRQNRKSTPTSALQGTVDGGGGDSSEQQISVYEQALVKYLKLHPMTGVPTDKLEAAVSRSKITLRDMLSLNGQPVSALNYPERMPTEIEFSRKDLVSMMTDRDRLVRLIFHEFLGLMKLEPSRDYKVSSTLNAAAIIHAVDLAAGKNVPTRLLTVDMSKAAPGFYSPLLGESAKYQCPHLAANDNWLYYCGAAYIQTEPLLGLTVLKYTCSAKLDDKDLASLGNFMTWEIPMEVSARYAALVGSVMVEWSAKFPKRV